MTTTAIAMVLALVVLSSGNSCSTQNCIHCYLDICSLCADRFYLTYTKNCEPCEDQNCKRCNRTACQQCQSKYFLEYYSRECQSCQKLNCLSCQSNGNCYACMQGYYQYQNNQGLFACRSCGSFCLMCSGSNQCSLCQDGNFLVKNGEESFCQSCSINQCLTCDAKGNCLTCPPNKYIYKEDSEGQESVVRCATCGSPNCLECQDSSQLCTKCRSGFYIVADQKDECQPCNKFGCKACVSPTNCSDCLDGYSYHEEKCTPCKTENCRICQEGMCTQCEKDYYLKPVDSELTCVSCSQKNCRTCERGRCTSCLPGHYLNGYQCLTCSDRFCTSCPGNKCQKCVAEHSVRYDTGICTRCNLEECLECDAEGDCIKCKEGLFIVNKACEACSASNCRICSSLNECYQCMDNYFNVEGQCQTCSIPSCSVCQSRHRCQTCTAHYYLTPENQCRICTIQNCDECSFKVMEKQEGLVLCQECQKGYEWNEKHKYCSVKVGEDDEPWWFVTITGIACTIIAVAVACYLYRCCLQRRAQGSDGEMRGGMYTEFQEIR